MAYFLNMAGLSLYLPCKGCVIPGLAVQANLQLRDVSLEMVEDLNHDRYKDDAKDRTTEVSSSKGDSGTVVSLGMA